MSSREGNGGAAMPATRQQRASEQRKLNPPWREVLELMKRPSTSLYRIYQRAGITKSQRYWLSRTPDLRLSVAYRIATAAEISPASFMQAVAEAMDPEPLVPTPEEGYRRDMNPDVPRRSCSICHKPGHNARTCRSQISSGALLLRARGAAMAAHDEKGA